MTCSQSDTISLLPIFTVQMFSVILRSKYHSKSIPFVPSQIKLLTTNVQGTHFLVLSILAILINSKQA